jgi:hypothetical protein
LTDTDHSLDVYEMGSGPVSPPALRYGIGLTYPLWK